MAVAAADSLVSAGRADLALAFVLISGQTIAETEEQYQAAEALRLRGQLFEGDGDEAAAESCYRQSIDIAERQGAKLFSLKATTRFAMLCAARGRREEGVATLRPIFEWFNEGLDSRDLVCARAALERCN
ncbi:MAG TPA: hypothetical protein VFU71_12845 [Burkholderiaceae bacterium]|nr:hypothetical protein [Burkholderiaceae bacterium]